MNSNPAANEYLRTKILTANPQELRLMLYEGAIKYSNQANLAIEKKDIEGSFDCLMRAQKIVLELSTSLNHDAAPEICEKLSAIYTYIYRLLVDANVQKDAKLVDEAVKLLEYEKQTWQMLMEKMTRENGGDQGIDQLNVTGAQQTAINSLSTDG